MFIAISNCDGDITAFEISILLLFSKTLKQEDAEINLCFSFGARSVVVVVAFSNDSVFGVSIENDAFSDVSVFKSLHFEQRFQMSQFLIVFSGNPNPKTETFYSIHTKTE